MNRPGERGDRSIALFLLALLLFSPLFLSLFSSEKLFLGFPPLFLYLFTAWGGIIAAVGWSAWRDKGEVDPTGPAKFSDAGPDEADEDNPFDGGGSNSPDLPKSPESSKSKTMKSRDHAG